MSTSGWVPTSAGAHLAGRRRRDTQPEVVLRRALHARGTRFRLQRRIAPSCTADIVLPRRRVAVFVDGCFWHACPEHGRRQPWAGPNARLWEQKLARTVARDANATTQALAAGWTVVRIWECAVTANVAAVAEQVLAPLPAGEAVVIGPTAPGA